MIGSVEKIEARVNNVRRRKGNEKCQEKQKSWSKCKAHQAIDRM